MSDTVHGLLNQLGQDQKEIQAALAQVTQRETVEGEIDYKLGKKYVPTVQDLMNGLVNDDPDHSMPDGFGAKVNELFYEQGNLLIRIWRAQTALGLSHNNGAEIMHAAQTGDYSKIRGA